MEIAGAIIELKEMRGDDNLPPFEVSEALDIGISSLEAWEQVKIKLRSKAIDCNIKGDKHGEHCFMEALKIIDKELERINNHEDDA
jgi:hypothetical protein